MSPERRLFTAYQEGPGSGPSHITVGNNHALPVEGRGDIILTCTVKGSQSRVLLKDVLHVPELTSTLISIPTIVDMGGRVDFRNNQCSVDMGTGVVMVAVKPTKKPGEKTSNLYYVVGAAARVGRSQAHISKPNEDQPWPPRARPQVPGSSTPRHHGDDHKTPWELNHGHSASMDVNIMERDSPYVDPSAVPWAAHPSTEEENFYCNDNGVAAQCGPDQEGGGQAAPPPHVNHPPAGQPGQHLPAAGQLLPDRGQAPEGDDGDEDNVEGVMNTDGDQTGGDGDGAITPSRTTAGTPPTAHQQGVPPSVFNPVSG
jgi:hypothetical protein